ncbi:unnamed protein product, partial [Owenia fusiformis]
VWSGWGPWQNGKCSTTCGPGKKNKNRVRRKLTVPNGPPTCPGESVETEYVNCDQPPCYGCAWSGWGPWQNGKCSTTCGPGKKYKSRVRRKLTVPNGPPTCPGDSMKL